MDEMINALDMVLFNDTADADILKQLSAFYAYKKKGMEVVEKVYPDMVAFVRENQAMSYNEVKLGLLTQLR